MGFSSKITPLVAIFEKSYVLQRKKL